MEQLRETEAALERARGAHATCAAGVAAALREAAEAAQAAAEAAAEAAAQADSAGGGEAAQVTSAQQAAKAAAVAAANAAKKAQKQSTAVTKVYQSALAKASKLCDKAAPARVAELAAGGGAPLDSAALNALVAQHLRRDGREKLAEQFVQEIGIDPGASLQGSFDSAAAGQLDGLLATLRARDAQPALEWAEAPREDDGGGEAGPSKKRQRASELEDPGVARSTLAAALHRLHVVSQLQGEAAASDPQKARADALAYCKSRIAPRAGSVPQYAAALRTLMGVALWAGRMHKSPYVRVRDEHWRAAEHQLASLFCAERGLSKELPLHTAVAAGAAALPQLLKLGEVLEARGERWAAQNELPVEIELPRRFRYRSVFTCPVSREQSGPGNPPTLLPCGHVLCKATVQRLGSRRNSSRFKCPYCPTDCTKDQCLDLVL